MVAKTFQNLEQVGDIFVENGRNYVNVRTKTGTLRKVRWYNDHEYARLYPSDAIKEPKRLRPLKDTLGFVNGTITVYSGDCESERDWFIMNHAQYNRYWGWFFPSNMQVPEECPEGLKPVIIRWEDVFVDENHTLPESVIAEKMNKFRSANSISQYVGEVGDRISRNVTVMYSGYREGLFGSSYFNIFKDEDNNTLVWSTTARSFSKGCKIRITGTVKEHKIYNGEKETFLRNCKVEEWKDDEES